MAVERVGVSFEPGLLEKFDDLISDKGYANRSEAIRDLVRKSLIEAEVEMGRGEVVGSLTIVYDHDFGDVTHRLLHLQHSQHSNVLATIHVHVDEHNCLEVIVIRGKAKELRKLADNIKAVKGVKHGELVITKTSFDS